MKRYRMTDGTICTLRKDKHFYIKGIRVTVWANNDGGFWTYHPITGRIVEWW